MTKTLVLAHGILGFDKIDFFGVEIANYFNGVKEAINPAYIRVITPKVKPTANVQTRAQELNEQMPDGNEDIFIIAHSMGGLDARLALHENKALRSRVKALVTLGTPHEGSKVADNVTLDNKLINKIYKNWLPAGFQGVLDLRTDAGEDFNNIVKEKYAEKIEFFTIAGVASEESENILLPFKAASYIGGFSNEPNDGVVTKESATARPSPWKNLEDWPVDHAGLIGWFKPTASPQQFKDHIDRYIKLISEITNVDAVDVRKPQAA
ncbi:MAG: hypothetical protein V4660_13005 [Pseudomonadota bacterium]